MGVLGLRQRSALPSSKCPTKNSFWTALHRFYTNDGNNLSDVAQHLADATSHIVG